MPRSAAFGLLLALCLSSSCKTGNSRSETFVIQGDPERAKALIVATVLANYPLVVGQRRVVEQFAAALAGGTVSQASSSDDVLQKAYAHDQAGSEQTEFDHYVVVEFLALTNYTTFSTIPGTVLTFTGTPMSSRPPA